MAGFLGVLNAFLHDQKIVNLKILFTQRFDFQTTDHNIINKYIIYKFNYKYKEMNIKDYCFQDSIQIDFAKFETKYFDRLNNAIQRVFRDYCYIHGFCIEHNFGFSKT